jgi:hypothetical protein
MRHLVTVVLACVIVGTVLAVSGALSPERAERGIAAFKDPFEAELAAAIVAFDVPRVKALLPRATYQNLNDLRGNTTLFVFALEQGGGPASPERLEMVKALLKARGFPGYPKGRALAAVATKGYEMNKLLLEAGADPDASEFAGRSPWRRWVVRDAQGREQVEMLKLFQKHGARLSSRDGRRTAVAEAVYAESWETALVLLEAGAYWEETGLRARAEAALAKYAEGEAPEALRKVVVRLD